LDMTSAMSPSAPGSSCTLTMSTSRVGGRIQDLDNAVEDPRVPKSTGSRRPALCHVVAFGLSK